MRIIISRGRSTCLAGQNFHLWSNINDYLNFSLEYDRKLHKALTGYASHTSRMCCMLTNFKYSKVVDNYNKREDTVSGKLEQIAQKMSPTARNFAA